MTGLVGFHQSRGRVCASVLVAFALLSPACSTLVGFDEFHLTGETAPCAGVSCLGGADAQAGPGGRAGTDGWSGGRAGNDGRADGGGGAPDAGPAGFSGGGSAGAGVHPSDGGSGGTDGPENPPLTDTVFIYAFNAGSWRKSDYLWPATTASAVTTGSFGAAGDLPFIWLATSTTALAKIGTYGTTADRLGYFYFDDNGDMQEGAGDAMGVRFRSDAQAGDKPFVLTAQLWGRDMFGQCVPTVSDGVPVTGRMVGVKRGTRVYLDRDGDGVWGTANHCDHAGTIGLAADSPSAIPSRLSTSGDLVLGLMRITGTGRTWFYDNNLDLQWLEPPDWTSALNAFGDVEQFVPFTNPGCIATSLGTQVQHDFDCNGVWQVGDSIYPSALPSAEWTLAGVDTDFQRL